MCYVMKHGRSAKFLSPDMYGFCRSLYYVPEYFSRLDQPLRYHHAVTYILIYSAYTIGYCLNVYKTDRRTRGSQYCFMRPSYRIGQMPALDNEVRCLWIFIICSRYFRCTLDTAKRSLGPFYGAIAVPSVTRCRCCRCRGHRCAGGVRQ